ncbi:RNA-binding protein [Candidatus Marinamargulisbacteria bacterium SCGC AAA071-K20]|nr:RNA-binding protein [Candidatus Marinamargulisbacteria bacterium SCGC AAA071-K20]
MSENKIFIGNLSFNTTKESLESEFSQYGEITETKLITDRDTGRSRGFGFVTFASADSLDAACEKNGQDLDGRTLRVNKAEERKPRESNSGYSNNRY